MWVKNNAAELAQLVSTISGMAMAIMNGQVGAVASAVNNVLKRLLPLVLGMLGALIGINGVITKIRGIFKKITAPARRAVRKLFMKFQKFVKKMLAKFKKKKKGKGKGKKGDKKGNFDGEIGERLTFSAGGEQHAIWVTQGAKPEVMMASSPKPLSQHLVEFNKRKAEIAKSSPDKATQAATLIRSAASQGAVVAQKAAAAKKEKVDSDARVKLDNETEKAEVPLRATLTQLLGVLGIQVPDEIKPQIVINFKFPSKLPADPTAADKLAGYTRQGFTSQLAGQERGINAMKAGDWQRNRERFMDRKSEGGSGRDPIAAALQQQFRAKQEGLMITALVSKRKRPPLGGLAPASRQFVQANRRPGGMAPADARAVVADWLATQAALHDPDQIAGGNPAGLKDLGSARINSSIGSQWAKRGRAQKISDGIAFALKGIPRTLWGQVIIGRTGSGGVKLSV